MLGFGSAVCGLPLSIAVRLGLEERVGIAALPLPSAVRLGFGGAGRVRGCARSPVR
jgi:hypothetical protein